jgi:hypothetical protein
MKGEKHRLVIDFRSADDMLDWFEDLRDIRIGAFPDTATIFKMDALDLKSITHGKTYIVKRQGDRPETMRVVVKRTTKTERTV